MRQPRPASLLPSGPRVAGEVPCSPVEVLLALAQGADRPPRAGSSSAWGAGLQPRGQEIRASDLEGALDQLRRLQALVAGAPVPSGR